MNIEYIWPVFLVVLAVTTAFQSDIRALIARLRKPAAPRMRMYAASVMCMQVYGECRRFVCNLEVPNSIHLRKVICSVDTYGCVTLDLIRLRSCALTEGDAAIDATELKYFDLNTVPSPNHPTTGVWCAEFEGTYNGWVPPGRICGQTFSLIFTVYGEIPMKD